MLFVLTVMGSCVLYKCKESAYVFDSHRQAWRYLLNTEARKVAWSDRCLSGMYFVA